MKIYRNISKKLSNILPNKLSEKIYRKMQFAGINDNFDFYVGSRVFLLLILFVIGFILPITLFRIIGITTFSGYVSLNISEFSLHIHWIFLSIIFATLFAGIPAIIYYMEILYTTHVRAKMVEKDLPDFLLLVANNLRAGMTTFSALRNSVRKEFGILSEEIEIVLTKSLGQEQFTVALKELNNRIDSQTLKTTISFFSEATKSGGKLARVLENTANDLRQRKELKEETKSNIRKYVIFILFIILFISPLLLSVSVEFLHVIQKLQQNTAQQTVENNQISFFGGNSTISPTLMTFIAYVVLLINSFLASLFMGLLGESKLTQGLKYFPILFFGSILVFSLSLMVLPKLMLTTI